MAIRYAARSLDADAPSAPQTADSKTWSKTLVTFYETGQVPRFPTAVLCTGLVISALLSFACGLILDTVTRGRQELKRLAYLSIPTFPWR